MKAAAFLRLACHDYENNPRQRAAEAQGLLETDPDLASASILTMAAVGDHAGLTTSIAADPDGVDRPGGPNDWTPLLHLAYSRVRPLSPETERRWSSVESMRVLLDAGADPNGGFLWQGNLPPFTALTGVIGGGERDESPHADALELARMLLEAGADPNDGQALYNKARHHHDDTGYLRLLLEFGLGTDRHGPWYEKYRTRLRSPANLLIDELANAAKGKPRRMRVLLEHGVDPDQPSGRSQKKPVRIAADGLHFDVLEVLGEAGVDVTLTPLDEISRTLLTSTPENVAAMRGSTEVAEVRRTKPGLLARAALDGRLDLIGPFIELGFDVNARAGSGQVTALHEAASTNNIAMATALIEHGADPTITDGHIGAPPLGWAEYEGNNEVAAYLRTVMPND